MELCLVVDHACNLRCSYCYSGCKTSKPMSEQTAERAIDLAVQKDPRELRLSFFGGEPLLRMEFIEHVTAYAKQRLTEVGCGAEFMVGLDTNATLVSERVVEFVKAYNTYAYVSLDGPPIVHDRHRLTVAGEGSHAQVKEGLLRLAAAGAKVGVVSVLNPDTAKYAEAVAEEILSLPVLRANVVCNLRAQWDDAALEALRCGLRGAMEPWKRAFRAGQALHFEPFTSKILTHLHAAMPCVSRCRLRGDDLTVAPSGRLYTCGERVGDDEDTTYSIGRLETGLDETKLASFREQKERIEVHCQDCEIRERCSSSCGCKHLALTGEYGRITSTLCDTEASFIEAADAMAEELHGEQCEAFLAFFYKKRWAPTKSNGFVPLRRKSATV
jgi:uncharacterized protein